MTIAQLTTYELDAGLATIRIDDGKVNALSIPMLESIHAELDQAEADGAVVVLGGREGYFSAGFDLRVFQRRTGADRRDADPRGTLCERLLAFPARCSAAVSGHAIAAGSFLALCADLRIGIDGPFKLGLNEVKIGLTMPLFVVELARHRLHPAHFDRALITAAMYEPAAAVKAGFLDRAVPAEEFPARWPRQPRNWAGSTPWPTRRPSCGSAAGRSTRCERRSTPSCANRARAELFLFDHFDGAVHRRVDFAVVGVGPGSLKVSDLILPSSIVPVSKLPSSAVAVCGAASSFIQITLPPSCTLTGSGS